MAKMASWILGYFIKYLAFGGHLVHPQLNQGQLEKVLQDYVHLHFLVSPRMETPPLVCYCYISKSSISRIEEVIFVPHAPPTHPSALETVPGVTVASFGFDTMQSILILVEVQWRATKMLRWLEYLNY